MLSHLSEAKRLFKERGGDKIKIYDSAYISVYDIEEVIKKYKPRFVIIDQGDKVSFRGQDQLSGTERLKELYRKFREIAKAYNVDIITAGQASASAEGKKWLQLDDMDNSKTGKPGELDFAIGIGKTEDDEARYLHLSKNKVKDGNHGKYVVTIEPMKARFKD